MDYPLVFTLVHDVNCAGHSLRVITRGRALVTFEDEEWWCHGVEPGGMTASAPEAAGVFAAFREVLGQILQDLGAEAGSLVEFESAVRAFVTATDEAEAERWTRARSGIRAGKSVEDPFGRLHRSTEESVSDVRVERLRHIAPAQDVVALAAAA